VKVQTITKEDGFLIKEEYHRFRSVTALVCALWPLLILVLIFAYAPDGAAGRFSSEGWRWESARAFGASLFRAPRREHGLVLGGPLIMASCQLLIVWLIYFYTALTIRELILKANGSNIRPWWMWHHYLSLAVLFLLLTLPVDSPAYLGFLRHFLFTVAQQGTVMVLYNRYQRRRMYTRIALGKASVSEVVGGESSGTSGQLNVLYPMLFAMQGYQIWVGAALVYAYGAAFLAPEGYQSFEPRQMDLRGDRGSCLLGVLFVVLGIGNFFNTVDTFFQKRRIGREYKKRGQGRGVTPPPSPRAAAGASAKQRKGK
jgi:hypothetical protein